MVIPAATVNPAGGSLFHRSAIRRSTRLRRSARSIAPRSARMPGHWSTMSCSLSSDCSQCTREFAGSRRPPRAGAGVDLFDFERIERAGEVGGQPQRLGRARALRRGRWTPGSAIARAGSIAGGIGASPIGSSAPPIRSSSSGSPTGISRGSSRPAPLSRTKASVSARTARLLGSRIRPGRGPAAPARSGGSTRRPAHRQTSGATGW